MILAMLCAIAIVSYATVLHWQAILMREHRWKSYALRDQLRRLAINDAGVRASEIFWKLDRQITENCSLDDVSLWCILPLAWVTRGRKWGRLAVERRREIQRLGNPDLDKIARKAENLLLEYFVYRHLTFVVVAATTIVGIIPVALLMRWASSVVGSTNLVRRDDHAQFA